MGSPTARGLRSPKPHIFTVSLSVLPALTDVDIFSDSDLFDESPPYLPPSDAAGAADPLTVSSDGASTRLRGEGVPRRAVYVIAALVLLVVAVLALHAGQQSPERHPVHGAVRGHHPRARSPRHRRRPAMSRRGPTEKAPAPVVATKVVVEVPNSGPERPTRTESVGTGRPTSTGQVGNTEQFGYLGR